MRARLFEQSLFDEMWPIELITVSSWLSLPLLLFPPVVCCARVRRDARLFGPRAASARDIAAPRLRRDEWICTYGLLQMTI